MQIRGQQLLMQRRWIADLLRLGRFESSHFHYGTVMETSQAIEVGRELMVAALLLSTPVVVVSLIVGLFISIAQTVTSIQEQTLSFAPRILAVCGVIVFLTPWYLQTLKTFTMRMFQRMAEVGI